ncbi:craniofacial development protein 2 [Biomphalaria glabrata]|nr:craniofacial development protein 2-like [Biomphalaria glabrata]
MWSLASDWDSTGTRQPSERLSRPFLGMHCLPSKHEEGAKKEEGQLTEVGAGYTFFWIGKNSEERCAAGVGFAVKSKVVNKLAGLPKDINDRLMTLRLPLTSIRHATLISACAPTMSNQDNTKENLYSDLNSAIIKTPKSDKLIILVEFNARVGSDWKTWSNVLDRHGIGHCNSNATSQKKRTSWIHPRSKIWHQIDFIIVRQSDRQDVKVTKALCGADCWTDHRLILSKLKICIKPLRRPQECKHAKRLDVGKLTNPDIKQGLINKLDSEIKTLHMNKDVKNSWNKLRNSVYSLASNTLGQPKRKHQDWFDENNVQIEQLLTHKQHCFKTFLCNDCNIQPLNWQGNATRLHPC